MQISAIVHVKKEKDHKESIYIKTSIGSSEKSRARAQLALLL
jgi:hypothetical protein